MHTRVIRAIGIEKTEGNALECIQGKCIVGGIAVGRIEIYKEKQIAITYIRAEDVTSELTRYEKACAMAIGQLQDLYEKAVCELGESEAQVFAAQTMFLQDEEYCASVKGWIEGKHTNAEYAVDKTGKWYAQKLQQLNDEYMRERSQDVKDVSDRVLSILIGDLSKSVVSSRRDASVPAASECGICEGTRMEEKIVFAKDLTPGQTMQMDKAYVRGFVTTTGSKNSHAAILAGAMNIPAVSGIEIRQEWNGKLAAVDGLNGKVYIEPDEQTLEILSMQSKAVEQRRIQLEELKGKKTITKSGKTVKLYANIAGKQDVAAVLENDAEGIGLFRTEFLYLNRNDYPTEEEQFLLYKYVVEAMQGKPVVIRTMDIGADKTVDYMGLAHEENPALGYRAIRICLTRKNIFRVQLRAILRAAVYGRVRILLPMIISVDEIRNTRELLDEVREELRSEGYRCGEVQLGVMIETPAAVMISKELAEEVDFFSVGTNDLTQYTLALDRQNAELDVFYNPYHPAVLRMLEIVISNAHEAGIEVGICGELAADVQMTKALVEMGIDELSVAPTKILQLRDLICQIN